MGSHHSSPSYPTPNTPWEPLTDTGMGQTVKKIYVYPKDTAATLYGVNSSKQVVTKAVYIDNWVNTKDGSTGFLAISGATMYKTGSDGKNISFAQTSGSGSWKQSTTGTGLSGIAVLGDKIYTAQNGVVATAPTSGGVLTVVPNQGTETIKEVCVSGGNIYATDYSFIYALTSPTSGPWVKMTSALPSGVTKIQSLCANSTRLFVVGSDGYVYGTC